ncbi:MAG TPA: hypothetical protein VLT82_12895 [Myxococcaceae bacterium]|nr:hypothetical protein [Myxococcaceae bacterium]
MNRLAIWSYLVGGAVLLLGVLTPRFRRAWSTSHGLESLILLGPLFYVAPLAAFGTEHFTLTGPIASLVPEWIPWHHFWTYLVGAGFIAAAISILTGILARLSASLVALTLFLFVVLMDVPAWAREPGDRFALTLALRQLAFSGGALALAASFIRAERTARVVATVARYFIGIPVLVYGIQQFMHGDHVPAVPLNRLTPEYVPGHALWTYLTALVDVLAGSLLFAGKRTREAATWIGLTVLLVVLTVYVPIAVADRASLSGLNYLADTLMFCGSLLLLAAVMPRKDGQAASSATQVHRDAVALLVTPRDS